MEVTYSHVTPELAIAWADPAHTSVELITWTIPSMLQSLCNNHAIDMRTQLRTVLLTFAVLVQCKGQDSCINNQIRLVSAMSFCYARQAAPQCHFVFSTKKQEITLFCLIHNEICVLPILHLTGWRWLSVLWSSGGVYQWHLGHHLWWLLGQQRCQCSVQTTGILPIW